MELYLFAQSWQAAWCSKRWMDYGHAPWLDTSTFNMRVVWACADRRGYLLESIYLECLSSYEWQHSCLVVAHSHNPPHLLQSRGRRDASRFCFVLGAQSWILRYKLSCSRKKLSHPSSHHPIHECNEPPHNQLLRKIHSSCNHESRRAIASRMYIRTQWSERSPVYLPTIGDGRNLIPNFGRILPVWNDVYAFVLVCLSNETSRRSTLSLTAHYPWSVIPFTVVGHSG